LLVFAGMYLRLTCSVLSLYSNLVFSFDLTVS
jgi:hypothetical protein